MFRSLLALVLLAPLPLGGVYPLIWWIMACVAGVLLLAHALGIARGTIPAEPVGPNWPWLIPFAAAAVWAALQASPLMPAAWHHPLWERAALTLERDIPGTISLEPVASISALIRLLTYAAVFWLALQFGASRRRAKAAFLALSFAAVAYAAYGLIETLTGANDVLWFAKRDYVDSVTSTFFFNRNNYATYAGLGLICVSGMIIQFLAAALAEPAQGRARALLLLEAMNGWRGLLLPVWIVLITALVLSNSRGGVLSSAAGLMSLLAAVAGSQLLRRRHALAVAGVIMLGAVAFMTFSGEKVAARLAGTDLDLEARPVVYALTAQEIAKSPWLGVGYGTFEEAFRFVRDERIKFEWDKAHNTYLENALELGVPAALLLTLSGAAMFVRCLIGLRQRRPEVIYPAIGIGASVLVACHSMVDFSLQIPAIAVTYAFIMGIAVIQSWPRRRRLPAPTAGAAA